MNKTPKKTFKIVLQRLTSSKIKEINKNLIEKGRNNANDNPIQFEEV